MIDFNNSLSSHTNNSPNLSLIYFGPNSIILKIAINMRSSTIDWMNHGNMPINSVDVQPRGYRILTGGSDNKVCIWNLLPIISREYELKGKSAPTEIFDIDMSVNNQNCAKSRNEEAKSEMHVD